MRLFLLFFTLTAFGAGITAVTPQPAHALGPLVTCGNSVTIDTTSNPGHICYTGECTVCDGQRLAQNILNLFAVLVTLVAALLFVYAGVLYIFSPTKPDNIGRAHRIFTSTLVGLIIVLAAYLLIGVVMGLAARSDWSTLLCQNEQKQHCVAKITTLTLTTPSLPVAQASYKPNTVCISDSDACNEGTCTTHATYNECRNAQGTLPECRTLNTTNRVGRCVAKTCQAATPVFANGCFNNLPLLPNCPPLASGPCSVAALQSVFGVNAGIASGICNAESGGVNKASGCDYCSNDPQKRAFSFGLFQINIRANNMPGGLQCAKSVFSDYKSIPGSSNGCPATYECTIPPSQNQAYQDCKAAALDETTNILKAFQLSNGGTNWKAWSKAGPCGAP